MSWSKLSDSVTLPYSRIYLNKATSKVRIRSYIQKRNNLILTALVVFITSFWKG